MTDSPSKTSSPKAPEKSKAPTSPDDQALAGPKVDRPASEKTNVERTYDGTLVRLETRPEQAAIALLTLTDDQKQPINKLFEDRATKLSNVLFDNLDTFLAVPAAGQAGGGRPSNDPKDREEIAGKMRELHKAGAEAGLIEPPLIDQVAKLLPQEQTPEFRRLVAEYMTALEQQAQKDFGANPQGSFSRPGNPTPDGPRARRPQRSTKRVQMNLFIRELARTLGAVVQERKEQADALYKAVDATPEQQAQIQKLIRDSAEKNKGKRPTPEQRAETFKKIMDLLTPEQRELARQHLRPPAPRIWFSAMPPGKHTEERLDVGVGTDVAVNVEVGGVGAWGGWDSFRRGSSKNAGDVGVGADVAIAVEVGGRSRRDFDSTDGRAGGPSMCPSLGTTVQLMRSPGAAMPGESRRRGRRRRFWRIDHWPLRRQV